MTDNTEYPPRTWRDWWPYWLTASYWAYILAPVHPRQRGWAYNNRTLDYANRVWCRLRNHPSGPIFYNAGGLELDPRCKDCGEEIG